jgi:type I restriction enzyme R subunit
MSPDISERKLESDICAVLTGLPAGGGIAADGASFTGEARRVGGIATFVGAPGGYQLRDAKADYDRARCLLPGDVYDFILATQPKEWEKYKGQHGADARQRLIDRLKRELERRGALDVLRGEVKDNGCKFRLAFFRPVSGLNEELRQLYQANVFSVVRQLRYSEQNENSIDLVLFLNGIPIFTAELKNPLNGQDVRDAVKQYRVDRDSKEPLLALGRCLAHFAVDADLVMVTTELRGAKTRFLPFNRGRGGGAGNEPVLPSELRVTGGYATHYLWREVWARDSVLNLVQHFIHDYEEEDDKGRPTGRRRLIFPRYHQLDCVRRLVRDARESGAGQRYLVQHSAGSGKSNSIAWLAHQLSVLHDAKDATVFDSVIVITDRTLLDRQLQRNIRQFEQVTGTVENIDKTSKQLKEALESGKKIVVTTLQKFPVISQQISDLPGKRFAVIVDEAHSSQAGESTKHVKAVLSANSLDEAAEQEAGDEIDDLEKIVAEEVRKRGRQANVSHFAFTATPKPKTLELFGRRRADGKYEPFSLYSMRQAIEEGFILDVLENYTTYKTYWRLLKTIDEDPRFQKGKASYLLRAFVELHDNAIAEKVRIMVAHFHEQVAGRIGRKAKAMIVTRSRLHAVRYFRELQRQLAEAKLPYRTLVAFSGTVMDGGVDYTESGMNGVGEAQTAATFAGDEFRFLVVANKFQTGFDQPLLHTMYVDKPLGGVGAVQTLSRLNRVYPGKDETMVLDFANDPDAIQKSFQDYYEATLLSEGTDPNQLYDRERDLIAFNVYDAVDVERFAQRFFADAPQGELHSMLAPNLERFGALGDEERGDFRKQVEQFLRLYSFLSQVMPFGDNDLEKLFVFLRLLRRRLPVERAELPREVTEAIDLESLRVQRTGSGPVRLERGTRTLDPQVERSGGPGREDPEEALSRIIAELNDKFGADLTEEDRVTLRSVMERLEGDSSLDAAVRANTRENAELTFKQKLEDALQDILDKNFKLYKRVTEDASFAERLLAHLFDRFRSRRRGVAEIIQEGESKTVEFKASLRWNKEKQEHDPAVSFGCLKAIAAFLNSDGGDLLIGVADGGAPVGIAHDQLESADKFMLHLVQLVSNALGDRSATCIDPRMQEVDGVEVCVVSCQPSPEPVFLKWKGREKDADGDFFVRRGPSSIRLQGDSMQKFIISRWSPADA